MRPPRRHKHARPAGPRPAAAPPGPPREVELEVERAVAGGRMLARHEGRVVLVRGAVPGERVRARLEREQKGVWFAEVVAVTRASADRRDPGPDPACGGMAYAHVAPARQRQLKADIVADAFARIARIPVAAPVVHASPEHGYRMRVRLHVREGRLGSFREGTHEVCDVRPTGQVLPATVEVVEALQLCLRAQGVARLEAVEIAENLDASQRVVHLDCGHDEVVSAALLAAVGGLPGITGVSVARAWAPRLLAASGVPWVDDPVTAFLGGAVGGAAAASGEPRLRRHARAFFQANRYLTPSLVERVLARLGDGPVVDLYAGVGLFAVAAAARGRAPVVAVEGDAVSCADLEANAGAFAGGVRVVHAPVEVFLSRGRGAEAGTLIVDPPRTGISREAMDGILAARAPRIVYVSCDVATMARDAGRLVEAGYGLGDVEAFDLFPNTAHVEALATFDRPR